jgi:nucleoside-diphosphate-sugar epimerase
MPKIAITGASGWLGRSAFMAIDDLRDFYPNLSVELFSHSNSSISLKDGRVLPVSSFASLPQSDFDILIPLAFLTREKYYSLGEVNYRIKNIEIMSVESEAIKRNPNSQVILISSGTVIRPSEAHQRDISFKEYGNLKEIQADTYRELLTNNQFSLCYLFSCTSKDFIKTEGYAFMDLVEKALLRKDIHIKNPNSVMRKYVDLRELFTVMISSVLKGRNFEISSSGPLIEIGALAELMVQTLESDSKIYRNAPDGKSMSDNYFSINESMNMLFEENGRSISGLPEQILNVASGFTNLSR